MVKYFNSYSRYLYSKYDTERFFNEVCYIVIDYQVGQVIFRSMRMMNNEERGTLIAIRDTEVYPLILAWKGSFKTYFSLLFPSYSLEENSEDVKLAPRS